MPERWASRCQRRWTSQPFLYTNYHDAELGYAVTDYTAQGRTVTAGLAVITGTEDRQHAYVALTRGTDTNTAYVFTTSPKRADRLYSTSLVSHRAGMSYAPTWICPP